MKKLILTATIAMFLFGGTNAVYGKYEDVIPVAEKLIKGLEVFLAGLEKAQSGAEVANALDGFTAVMKKVVPEFKKLQKKYPEMDDNEKVPPELKPVQDKIDALFGKMGTSIAKVYKYIGDPKVAEANKRWQEAMKKMDPKKEDEAEEDEAEEDEAEEDKEE